MTPGIHTIDNLIQQCLNTKQYQSYQQKDTLQKIWYTLFPHTRAYVKNMQLKHDTIYISLSSTLYTYDLQLQKKNMLLQLKNHLNQQQHTSPLTINNIIFS